MCYTSNLAGPKAHNIISVNSVFVQKEMAYQLVYIYNQKWMPMIISELVVEDIEKGNLGLH